ncbi:hypothetical protein EMCRGX_G008117 [Ephydatia muelleri]
MFSTYYCIIPNAIDTASATDHHYSGSQSLWSPGPSLSYRSPLLRVSKPLVPRPQPQLPIVTTQGLKASGPQAPASATDCHYSGVSKPLVPRPQPQLPIITTQGLKASGPQAPASATDHHYSGSQSLWSPGPSLSYRLSLLRVSKPLVPRPQPQLPIVTTQGLKASGPQAPASATDRHYSGSQSLWSPGPSLSYRSSLLRVSKPLVPRPQPQLLIVTTQGLKASGPQAPASATDHHYSGSQSLWSPGPSLSYRSSLSGSQSSYHTRHESNNKCKEQDTKQHQPLARVHIV